MSESEKVAAALQAEPLDAARASAIDDEDRLRPEFVDRVLDAVDAGDDETARKLVAPLHPADVADLIELAARDERDGLVNRTVTPSIPPRVDYELTELGKSLQKPICGLASWAMENVEAIHKAQARFDAEADKAEAA